MPLITSQKNNMIANSPNILLSITIPTWNRSKTLEKSLSILLPQVLEFKDIIEIIISDNHSSDDTAKVINSSIEKYQSINFITYFQKENTGFFGNFKKCKELANGQFVWILSDDDFIQDGVIQEIIQILKIDQADLGILYLDNNERQEKGKFIKNRSIKINSLFKQYHYNLTLASSVIFYNKKDNDNVIYNVFKGSNLIGYALLVDVIRYKKSGTVLTGYLMQCRMASISGYNIFDAFVFDLSKILKYMLEIGYEKDVVSHINNAVLKHILVKRYFFLKAKGKMDSGLQTYPLKKVEKILKEQFGELPAYKFKIIPIKYTPQILIKISFPIIEKLRNLIRSK
ncbi:MAG: glycosyltransferase family 2 protein [Sphingobacteriaceae bacterium]|nr:glycosyltransferase family 2 protein [Sphingobacteriaceae bacterium]